MSDKNKKDTLSFIKKMLPSKEELEMMHKDKYNQYKDTPENMSYWYPKIIQSKNNSQLKVPITKIIPLTFEWWVWLNSGNYTDDKKIEFKNYLLDEIGNFENGKKLFLKTGVFSNKFVFKWTECDKYRTNIHQQFLDIFYSAILLGANMTSELVVREFIESKENVPKIYEGMPLHTEFRVFYDFDNRDIVGISNYWNPDVMTFEK